MLISFKTTFESRENPKSRIQPNYIPNKKKQTNKKKIRINKERMSLEQNFFSEFTI